MNLKSLLCRVLAFLRIQGPDCASCNHRENCSGDDMRKRLEELRENTQGGKPTVPIPLGTPLPIDSNISSLPTVTATQDVPQDKQRKTG
jgi:hypothetical protein